MTVFEPSAPLPNRDTEIEDLRAENDRIWNHFQDMKDERWDVEREYLQMRDRAEAAEAEIERLRAEVAGLSAKLDLPCGSCHPCTEWANQTWVNAGRHLPHLHEWDEALAERDQAREVLARVEALCDEWDDTIRTESQIMTTPQRNAWIGRADELRRALSTPAESPTVEGGQAPEPDLKWAEMFGVMRGASFAADDETSA